MLLRFVSNFQKIKFLRSKPKSAAEELQVLRCVSPYNQAATRDG